MTDRGWRVTGAGEAASPGPRIVKGVQARCPGLQVPVGEQAAEVAHDLLRRVAQASQDGGGGPELAHDRRGVDVVAGDVADDQRDLAVLQRDDVEPVAACLRGPVGRLVAVGDLEACYFRDGPGQQAALEGDGGVALAGVEACVVDVHRRAGGEVADQLQVGVVIRIRLFGPGEGRDPQGSAAGDQGHGHQRVDATGEKGLPVTGRVTDLAGGVGQARSQQGRSTEERSDAGVRQRRDDLVTLPVPDVRTGHDDPAKPHEARAAVLVPAGIFAAQHLVEQVYRDPVGELGNGEIGELRACLADVERGADLAAGPCEQVEPGTGPLKVGGCPLAFGDIDQPAHRPGYPAVIRDRERRPGIDSAHALDGPLRWPVDQRGAGQHLLGEDALDHVPVQPAGGSLGDPAAQDLLARCPYEPAELIVDPDVPQPGIDIYRSYR